MKTIDLDKYGFRVGSIRSRAAQMYEQGATQLQVKNALGSHMFTILAELKGKGWTVTQTKIRIGKSRPHFKYTIMPKEANDEEKKSP